MRIAGLDHLVLTVADPAVTADFYTRVLGMERVEFGLDRLALRFGQQKINLHPAAAPIDPHAKRPVPGSADLCFLVEGPVAATLDHLAALDVAVEQGPVTRTGALGPITSVYLRDPDGNLIELGHSGAEV
jgi:catechol 2,3-dioxygenase-like lactoylglutathione lyase family enzyme